MSQTYSLVVVPSHAKPIRNHSQEIAVPKLRLGQKHRLPGEAQSASEKKRKHLSQTGQGRIEL